MLLKHKYLKKDAIKAKKQILYILVINNNYVMFILIKEF